MIILPILVVGTIFMGILNAENWPQLCVRQTCSIARSSLSEQSSFYQTIWEDANVLTLEWSPIRYLSEISLTIGID